jgi:hypothetical protein
VVGAQVDRQCGQHGHEGVDVVVFLVAVGAPIVGVGVGVVAAVA